MLRSVVLSQVQSALVGSEVISLQPKMISFELHLNLTKLFYMCLANWRLCCYLCLCLCLCLCCCLCLSLNCSASSNNWAGDKRESVAATVAISRCLHFQFCSCDEGCNRAGLETEREGRRVGNRHRKKQRSLSALLEPKRNFASFRVIGQNHSECQGSVAQYQQRQQE